MTAEHFEAHESPDPEQSPLNALPLDFVQMSRSETYDVESKTARQARQNFIRTIPAELDETAVRHLGVAVFRASLDHANGNEHQMLRQAERAERRFLSWLGNASLKTNVETAKSVRRVLSHDFGVRGKLGALSLAAKQITQY